MPDDADGRTPTELAYLRAVLAASVVAAELLAEMERVAEALAPERSAQLAAAIAERFGDALAARARDLAAAPAPTELAEFHRFFAPAFEHARACADLFAGFPAAPAAERIPRILTALHHHAQAQEHFYPIRALLPPFRDYWSPDPPPSSPSQARPSLTRVSAGGHHGGFALYVPEQYEESRAWPVIVALHGGSGNGRDFLWTWVRDAKRTGHILIAPTAVGATWGEVDELGLLEILAWTRARYRVAEDRVLLTGLSDGGTFTLLYGLAHPDVFRALDFLFPVALAHLTRDTLAAAGAGLVYREIAELSHTYPRSENAAILEWFTALASSRAT